MLRSSYTVSVVGTTPQNEKIVFIIDNDAGMTVTNDAENVVLDILRNYPNHRIVYRDTEGIWDEILHRNGEYIGFSPYKMPLDKKS